MNHILQKLREFGGICGVLKTIIFNFSYFPFKIAVKFPVWISSKTRFSLMKKGNIVFDGCPKRGCIRIGVHNHKFSNNEPILLYIAGNLCVDGKSQVTISSGSFIGIGPDSLLDFKGFAIVGNDCRIVCHHHIIIGQENIIQDRCCIMDHETFEIIDGNNKRVNPPKAIKFGKNVWIQPYSIIKEGVFLSDNTIVSAGTVLRQFETGNSPIGQSIKINCCPPIERCVPGLKIWDVNFRNSTEK